VSRTTVKEEIFKTGQKLRLHETWAGILKE
jgi:hypothetical protein